MCAEAVGSRVAAKEGKKAGTNVKAGYNSDAIEMSIRAFSPCCACIDEMGDF